MPAEQCFPACLDPILKSSRHYVVCIKFCSSIRRDFAACHNPYQSKQLLPHLKFYPLSHQNRCEFFYFYSGSAKLPKHGNVAVAHRRLVTPAVRGPEKPGGRHCRCLLRVVLSNPHVQVFLWDHNHVCRVPFELMYPAITTQITIHYYYIITLLLSKIKCNFL